MTWHGTCQKVFKDQTLPISALISMNTTSQQNRVNDGQIQYVNFYVGIFSFNKFVKRK